MSRIAVALSACALVVVVLTETPAGDAAGRIVPLAAFAKNAGKVNNIKASRNPRANSLLPLDRHAKLPASVLPVAAQGPAGPAGKDGKDGKDGTDGKDGGLGRVVQWTSTASASGTGGSILIDQVLRGEKAWALTARVSWTSSSNLTCRLFAGDPAKVDATNPANAVDTSSSSNYYSYAGQMTLLGVAGAGAAGKYGPETRVIVACDSATPQFAPTRVLAVPASSVDVNS